MSINAIVPYIPIGGQVKKYVRELPSRIFEVVDRTFKDVSFVLVFALPTLRLLPPVSKVVSVRWCERIFTILTVPALLLGELLYLGLPKIHVKLLGDCTNWYTKALAEELVFRGFVQTIVLKEIPRRVLRWCAPGYETVIDHKVVKVARVVITAVVFALAHDHLFDTPGFLVSQLLGGLYLGYLREDGVSLFQLSCIHSLSNMGVQAWMGAMVYGVQG